MDLKKRGIKNGFISPTKRRLYADTVTTATAKKKSRRILSRSYLDTVFVFIKNDILYGFYLQINARPCLAF